MKGKNSGAGIIVLVIIGGLVKYWEFVVAASALAIIGYGLYRLAKAQDKKYSRKDSSSDEGLYEIHTGVSRMKNDAKFIGNSQNVVIFGKQVPIHLAYVESAKASQHPHVICLNASFGTPDNGFNTSMGYWPSFSKIDKNDRATYIHWLQQGRRVPHADIGVVFLYFYGLEFRILADDANESDRAQIFSELQSLMQVYGSRSGSFANYCSGFMTTVMLNQKEWSSQALDIFINYLLENPEKIRLFEDAVSGIASKIDKTQAFPLLFLSMKNPNLPVSLKGVRTKLIKSFFSRITNAHVPEKCFKSRKIKHEYRSASALHMSSSMSVDGVQLTAMAEKQAQTIWDSCLSDYKNFEKLKKVSGDVPASLAPDFVRSQQSQTGETGSLFDFEEHKIVEVYEVLRYFDFAITSPVTAVQGKVLASALERIGISIEPDARITGKGLKFTDKIILVKRELGVVEPERWNSAIPLFDLAMAVAAAEDGIIEKEVNHAIEFVSRLSKLTSVESERLAWRAKLLAQAKLSASTIARKIGVTLTTQQKEKVANFLFSVAAIDGRVGPDEVFLLRKSFKDLKLDDSMLDRLTNGGILSESIDLVQLGEAKAQIRGTAIPPKPSKQKSKNIVLNEQALEAAFKEAHEVSAILAEVFVEEESLEKDSENAQGLKLSDLEAAILKELLIKDCWLLSDIEALCFRHKIMYGAFLTSVNDFFENCHGSAVLEEDGDSVLINSSIAQLEVKSA